MQVCVFLCTTCQTRSRLLSALQLIRQRTVSALSITQSLFVLCSSKLLSLIFFFIFIETEEDSNYRYIRYSKYKLQTLKIVEFLRCENNQVQTKHKNVAYRSSVIVETSQCFGDQWHQKVTNKSKDITFTPFSVCLCNRNKNIYWTRNFGIFSRMRVHYKCVALVTQTATACTSTLHMCGH